MNDYRTIRGTSVAEIEEKHSRFIASAAFADTEEKALAFLEKIRSENRTARHNVFAYCLREGNRARYSDDGEPAKTAGTPVLECIQHRELKDVIVVVTRYFGGILLGTGGLVRAYTASAVAALDAAQVVTVRACVRCRVTVEYGLYERAMLLISGAGAQAEEPVFTDKVELCFVLPAGQEQPLIPAFRELTRGAAQLECSEPFYTPF